MTVRAGALGGFVLAAITIGVIYTLPVTTSLLMLGVLLALISGVYVGFGVADGRPSVLIAESIAALAFLVLIVYAFSSLRAPGLFAIGYFLHGAWDLAHHPGPLLGERAWYAIGCVVYDWIIGGFLILGFS